jgi:hypothetical protein
VRGLVGPPGVTPWIVEELQKLRAKPVPETWTGTFRGKLRTPFRKIALRIRGVPEGFKQEGVLRIPTEVTRERARERARAPCSTAIGGSEYRYFAVIETLSHRKTKDDNPKQKRRNTQLRIQISETAEAAILPPKCF